MICDQFYILKQTFFLRYLGRRAGQTIASLTVQHNVRTTNSSPMHGHQPPPGPGLSFVSQGSTTPGHVSGIGEITAYLEYANNPVLAYFN